MAVLEPFSPPFPIEKKVKRYGCYIDIDRTPHEASWTGDWAIFDFTTTSQIPNFKLSPLQFTKELSAIWKSSSPLAFGSHASVRSSETTSYPVVKIAHPTHQSRRLIEREFNIMRDLSKLDAVARVAGEPLTDRDGIFGFRLERLYHVDLEDLQSRFQEVQLLLDSLHAAGYCHGDCSFSNIMQNQDGRLVLIDLAFAGPLGSKIPKWFPIDVSPEGLYAADVDRENVRKWAEYCC